MIKRFNFCKLLFSLLLLIFSAHPVCAESFRVHRTVTLPLAVNGTPYSVKAGINDAVIILLPEDKTFLQGYELFFKVPQTVAEWRDSVAWCFYDPVSPEPDENIIDYTGEHGPIGTFNSLSINVQVPLDENCKDTIKRNAYSKFMEKFPVPQNNKVFLRMQLAMKGVPEDIDQKYFEITAKPILNEKGRLLINAVPPAETELQSYTVYVDGNAEEIDESGLIIDSGIHDISIVSDFYRNELRTVTVEKAQNTSVNIQLRDIAPSLVINCPDIAELFLDDEPVENNREPFTVSQGEHQLRITAGNYETLRTINALNGRSYRISVSIEVDLEEEE